ncbi:hypothetical protein HK405_009795, partial [Cladochytrium tenue]
SSTAAAATTVAGARGRTLPPHRRRRPQRYRVDVARRVSRPCARIAAAVPGIADPPAGSAARRKLLGYPAATASATRPAAAAARLPAVRVVLPMITGP